jgi:hypothetical protein
MDFNLAPMGGNAAHDEQREKGNQENPSYSLLIQIKFSSIIGEKDIWKNTLCLVFEEFDVAVTC